MHPVVVAGREAKGGKFSKAGTMLVANQNMQD